MKLPQQVRSQVQLGNKEKLVVAQLDQLMQKIEWIPHQMNLSTIKALMTERKFDEALRKLDETLIIEPENGYLWQLRGNLIQLLDRTDGPPLSEVERSYLKALEINQNDLSVIEELAHYYDVLVIDADKAKKYACEYPRLTQKASVDMNEILQSQ